jgi:hypothetical protein
MIPDTMYPDAEVMHVGKCCKCRRLLTTPESIQRGIGPECSGEKRKKKNSLAGKETTTLVV